MAQSRKLPEFADLHHCTATLRTRNQIRSTDSIAIPKDLYANNIRNLTNNHSTDNLDYIEEMTELDSCKETNYGDESESRYLIKNDRLLGNKIVRQSLAVDDNSSVRMENLKFKCRNARELRIVHGSTAVPIRIVTTLLVLLLAATMTTANPITSRHTRSLHEQTAKGYLEMFGYLKKGELEVGNLLMGDVAQSYEDDFRIAIKTLQEFGGIPVTGEIDKATMELMKKKRCGRPDREINSDENVHRKKRFAVQGEKWKHTNLTWSLSSSRRPSHLDLDKTLSVLARALDVWQQASRLTFTKVNSDEADIVVSFARKFHGDPYPFDGRGSILAHAFFPGSGNGGDAHFDDDELWLLDPINDDEEGTSLFAVAVHEFGHSLGLSHSSVQGALMYPWYQGIQPNFVLPEDDRNGIQQMYGTKIKQTWAKIPNYYPAKTSPPTTSSTTTTTTTTRRPYIHHHNRHPERHPNYRPYTPYPRNPGKYPAYYPERPRYPEQKPYYPDHRHYNTTHPRHHYPRPTPPTTTLPTSSRPRFHPVRPETPSYPRQNYPEQDPKDPYYPPKTTPKPSPPPEKPDTCDTNYDAVALIRGELFIFKNTYHWRIGVHGRYPGYPIEISRMWTGLPRNLTHVDAVYERPDRKIAIFVGKELYLFDSLYLVRGYPKPLTHLGLPHSLEKLDAAMIWGHNSKTYFYSGTMYWKFDEEEGRVELDYPRDMAMWKGVGYNIDSVFQWKDGKTYFFKGKGFWKFNDLQMRVEQEKQQLSAPVWMGCPEVRSGRRAPYRAPAAPGSTLRSPSSNHAPKHSPTVITLLATYLLLVFSFNRPIL